MAINKVICLTPVKNEAWILEKFLQGASLWADQIIIADQGSTDNSRAIASRFVKVSLLNNPGEDLDEAARQRILLQAARKFSGPRLLVTLDADEFLSANYQSSPEWQRMLHAPPGTVFKFQWVNLTPDFKSYWIPKHYFPWAFCDDGSAAAGKKIHGNRLPCNESHEVIKLHELKVLHYQYTDWARMQSKHRFYQCWERVNNPNCSAVRIYRQYHHMDQAIKQAKTGINPAWINGYLDQGIELNQVLIQRSYWWDLEVIKYLQNWGNRFFAREAIWEVDWEKIARHYQIDPQACFSDPRNRFEKLVHRWLQATQSQRKSYLVKSIDRLLGYLGW